MKKRRTPRNNPRKTKCGPVSVRACVRALMYVRMFVCVCERERKRVSEKEREREGERERERERERES